MKWWLCAPAIVLAAGTPALGHRLDEYLEATIISVDKNSVKGQMSLTPGVAVYPAVLAGIHTNADGTIAGAEQLAYAERVLRDLSLSMNGERLRPRLVSIRFPALDEMKEGLGEIQLTFRADLPPNGPKRKLIFENHHQSRIAAYQVNCLVPSDPDIRIVAQTRNYFQSLYELEYEQAGVRGGPLASVWWPAAREWLGTIALVLFAWLAVLFRQSAETGRTPPVGGR